MLGLALCLGIVFPVLVFAQSAVLHQILMGNFPMRMRWLFHQYLLKQSIDFYTNEFAGRISTKMMQTALAVRDSVIKICDVGFYILVLIGSMALLLASTSWLLALPILGWVVLYCSILKYFLPKLKSVAQAQANARSDMTGRVVDAYSNIMTVKLFSHSSRELNYAKDAMNPFLETVHHQMRIATLFTTAIHSSVYLIILVEFSLCIWLWMNGTASIGMISVAIMLTLRLNGLSEWIMWEANMFFENLGTVTDGIQTLAKPVELVDQKDAKPLAVDKGQIEFKNVSFHYGKSSGVIENFNLTIKPGEKIGIVGRSGAGKSTLVNLLLRFYDVAGGEILIDGQNIAKVQQETLRQQIGVVTQDTALLHRSIRENIVYGSPNATEEEMIKATEKAQAYDFIQQLEDHQGQKGFDTLVGERGIKLSGGQRQRVAISRVLLKNAPFLILDEATSALDSEVEQAIQDNLNQLMENKTVIAIAHRLSTIAALDRLVVIDDGRIIEQGTHEELLQQKGVYAQLWAHQSGGFV